VSDDPRFVFFFVGGIALITCGVWMVVSVALEELPKKQECVVKQDAIVNQLVKKAEGEGGSLFFPGGGGLPTLYQTESDIPFEEKE
jgi:hypothetical protein